MSDDSVTSIDADELPPGHPAGTNPAVSSGEVLSEHRVNPAGSVGPIDLEDPDGPAADDDVNS